jgi:hypothetical protein
MTSPLSDDLQRGEKIYTDHTNLEKLQTYERAPPFDGVSKTLGAGVSILWKYNTALLTFADSTSNRSFCGDVNYVVAESHGVERRYD